MICLSDLKCGSKARIVAIKGRHSDILRLQELGLTAGAQVEMLRILSAKQRLQVQVRHTLLCFRKEEADCFFVEPILE